MIKKIRKIMLALPNTRWDGLKGWHTFPYTIALLSAVIKEKYEVSFLDADVEDLSPDEVRERIAKENPDVIGISCLSMEYANGYLKIAETAKSVSKDIIVVVGGIYPTLLPKALLSNKNVDYVIMGEGEYRFPKLLEHLEKKSFPIEEIDGPKRRYRSAEDVLKEVKWLIKEYGIKEIIFLDDNLYADKKRMKKILLGLIEIKRKHEFRWKSPNVALYALDDEILELAKKSGCYQMAIAIESGNEEVLKLMKKPLKISKAKEVVKKARELGIVITAMFVIGIPGETWEQIRQTFRFAEELDLDYVSFSIATPLPCTELYDIAKRDNLLPADFEFSNLDFKGFGKAAITTDEFTPQELQIVRAFEWDRINFKNKDKWPKIAEMNGITLEELKRWRVRTRRGVGLNVDHDK